MALGDLRKILSHVEDNRYDERFFRLLDLFSRRTDQRGKLFGRILAASARSVLSCHQKISKLGKANRRLLGLMNDRNNYFQSASHELRTPLQVLTAYASSLEDEVFGEINPGQRAALQQIQKATDSLLSVVNDILDLSKLEADSLAINPVDIEYEDLVLAVTEFVLPLARNKSIDLRVDVQEADLFVYADPERTEQVLRNLLANAIKFTPEGGSVVVSVSKAYPDGVTTMVRDTGPGIPKDAMKDLFKPFFQVNQVECPSRGGTGLGLSIAKALVDRMGGSMEVDSEPGEGTTFIFQLPPSRATAVSREMASI